MFITDSKTTRWSLPTRKKRQNTTQLEIWTTKWSGALWNFLKYKSTNTQNIQRRNTGRVEIWTTQWSVALWEPQANIHKTELSWNHPLSFIPGIYLLNPRDKNNLIFIIKFCHWILLQWNTWQYIYLVFLTKCYPSPAFL